MFPRIEPNRVRALLLALFLLVAQGLLLQHQTDLDLHATGDHCEWCLTHTPLAGMLPSAAPLAVVPVRDAAPDPARHATPGRYHSQVYRSRAPPALSA
jgi:hypothetical protein